MRQTVTERGHEDAVLALVNANLLAAHAAISLANRLQGYAAMAGDDATATDFATSYDDAAAATITALPSLVGACGTLAHLVEASLVNHHRAEARATLPGWARTLTGPPTAADASVGVALGTPPSALGADTSGPGGLAGVALDALQGVFWPNADTTRLRSAASAWSSAADSLDLITARCDSAVAALEAQRSPEVPLAVAVIDDLRTRVDDLTTQLTALGTACTEYADHVDAKRHELLDLLEDLAVELGVGAVVAGGLSVLSGGAAAGLAGGAGAARIATASSRFRSILDSLRILTAGPALQARPLAVTASEIGSFTTRITRARVMLMEAGEGAGGTGRRALEWRAGWLARHERSGSHTLAKHVGKSHRELTDRLSRQLKLPFASSFRDQRAAEHYIEQVIHSRRSAIDDWLRSGRFRERFSCGFTESTGRTAARDGSVIDARRVRVVLERDASMPEGFRVLTAFPEP